jgi:4-amino-4-deoxy-L-arabinose transferase-like glycosyltransferase
VRRALLADLGVLVGLAAVLLVAGLGATALTDRDEGANAGAAREMLDRGSWVTPLLNGVPRFAKPALAYWLMAAGYAALGVSEAAARLPSALAGLALVLVQYAFARWALGARAGRRAALALLLALEVVLVARMALTDSVLVLCTTTAVFALFRAHQGPAPRGRWEALGGVALGLGLLAKGPVGLLIPALAVAAHLAVTGGGRRAWREGHPVRVLLLALLLAAPWYLAMFWLHGADYAARARGETLGRVVRTVTGPGGTVLFYLPVLLIGFFPWSAWLPDALRAAWRARAAARAGPDRRAAILVLAAAWLLAGLAVFSLVPSRLPHYALPLFPPAALLVAAAWPDAPSRLARGLLAGTALALAGLVGAAVALGPALTRVLATAYPAEPGAHLPPRVLLLALPLLGLAAGAVRGGAGAGFGATAAAAALLTGLTVHVGLRAFDAAYVAPGAALARTAGLRARPCDALASFGPYRPSFLFYARRPLVFAGLRDPGPLEAAAGPGALYLLTPAALRGALPPALAGLAVVESRGGYLLLARPGREPCA